MTTVEKEIIVPRDGVVILDEDVDPIETQPEQVEPKDKPIIPYDNNPIPDSEKNLKRTETEPKLNQPINQNNEQPPSNLEDDKYQEKLEEYKQLFSYLISEQNYRKDRDYITQTLKELKEKLGLKNTDVVAIEAKVTKEKQTVQSKTPDTSSIPNHQPPSQPQKTGIRYSAKWRRGVLLGTSIIGLFFIFVSEGYFEVPYLMGCLVIIIGSLFPIFISKLQNRLAWRKWLMLVGIVISVVLMFVGYDSILHGGANPGTAFAGSIIYIISIIIGRW
ncbi:MAG: hypothetical protein WBM32_17505 [Crocosphaera sp.]